MEYQNFFNYNENFSWEKEEEIIFFNSFFSVLHDLKKISQQTNFISHHVSLQESKRLFIEKIKSKFMELLNTDVCFENANVLLDYLLYQLSICPVKESQLPLLFTKIEICMQRPSGMTVLKDSYITPDDVAILLKCTVRHVRDLYWKEGKLSYKKEGRRVLIESRSVTEYLEGDRK